MLFQAQCMDIMRDHHRPPNAPGLLRNMHRFALLRLFAHHLLPLAGQKRGDGIAIRRKFQHLRQNLAVGGQAQHRVVHATLARQFIAQHIVAVIVHRAMAIDIGIHPDHAGAFVDHVQAKPVGKECVAVLLLVFYEIFGVDDLAPVAKDDPCGHVRDRFISEEGDLLTLVHKGLEANLFQPTQCTANPECSNLAYPCHQKLSF